MQQLLRLLLVSPGFAGMAFAVPAAANPDPSETSYEAQRATAFADLYNAINDGIDSELFLDRISASIAQQIATADPTLVEIEARFPGFSAALTKAIRPVLQDYSERVNTAYRPRMIGAFEEILSAKEASEIAAFYRSTLGLKILGGTTANYDGKATIASALHDDDIDGQAVETDIRIAANRVLSLFSKAELEDLGRMAIEKPSLQKLEALSTKTTALRIEMENEPLTAEEEAEMERLIFQAAETHIANFDRTSSGT